jgi:drug/metabolite transporter (DMT)-like permease
MSSSYIRGLILVTAAAIAWSMAGVFTRSLVVDAPTILFWRGAFGALGTLVVIAALPGGGGLKSFRHLGWPGWTYAGVTALAMVCFISALLKTSVAHVAIITAIVPFVAASLGWLAYREVPGRSVIVASVVALAGVAIIAGVSSDGAWQGDILALAMTLCMGVMILLSRKYVTIPALPATCVASGLSALFTLAFASLTSVTTHDLFILAGFAVVTQVLGFGLFALGARLLPPMETALITALDAPLSPFWVWLAFAETPGITTVIGGIIVLAAVVGHVLVRAKTSEA